MEYELYLYCSAMGCLIIFLIVGYHFLNEEPAKPALESRQPATL